MKISVHVDSICIYLKLLFLVEVKMDNKWIRKGKRKLWVDIPEDLYEQVKLNAKKRNLNFTKYINRILMRYLIEENKYENQSTDVS